MKISREADGLHLEFTAEEAGLMTVLAHQFADVVRNPEVDDAPLLAALFPDAYRDDAEAASEFHHYTRADLEHRKIEAAESIAGTAQEGLVVLDADAVATWVRALTAIRTMIATRLGIGVGAHPGSGLGADLGASDGSGEEEPPAGVLRDIYEWLGELQWVLVDSLDAS